MRKLIEEAIVAEGIQILVKQVNLFTPEFEQKLAALKSDEARASEMEHAIRDEIHVKFDEDPVFFSSLRQRLEQIIEDRKARRIDAAEQLKLYGTLRTDIKGPAAAAQRLGLSETSYAIYGLLTAKSRPLEAAEERPPYQAQRDLAAIFEDTLRPQTELVDWSEKEKVQKEMRRLIKRQLRASKYSDAQIEPLAEEIVNLLKSRQGWR